MQQYTTVVVMVFISQVSSKSHCIGTCYSGQLFPEPQDIFHGKHLKGYSYNNITTDDPVKCYSSCIQDCRCKACQMKDSRCELLDEDKTSKADDFVSEPGYVHFDIKQTMYQARSHMVPPGFCYNGCCLSQPCLNGGACQEHCGTPKHKFSCNCSLGYIGMICKTRLASCKDVMTASKGTLKNGVYRVIREDKGNAVPIYCSFEPSRAWTLIESSVLKDNMFKMVPFYISKTINQENPSNWDGYRMSFDRMKYIRSKSTLFRATCDFPNRVSLTPDLLIGNLSDVDIINEKNIDGCRRYLLIDILGYNCSDCTGYTVQGLSAGLHIHLDVTWNSCNFRIKPPQNIKSNTDSFGFFATIDEKSKCNARPQSTTQWWLGEEI